MDVGRDTKTITPRRHPPSPTVSCRTPGRAPSRFSASTTRPTAYDRAWHLAFWAGLRVARVWWSLARRSHEGALVALYVGPGLLLLRTSYRKAWSLPGGGVKAGEVPIEAARRELEEEIGITADLIGPASVFTGIWDGRTDRVHIYELQLGALPRLRLDNREIVDARLFGPDELDGLAVIGPVAAYLARAR